MKTKEELNALREEVEALNKKLHELTEAELTQISGGMEGGEISDTLDAYIKDIRKLSSFKMNELINRIEKEFNLSQVCLTDKQRNAVEKIPDGEMLY